jgi:hypothetical protein
VGQQNVSEIRFRVRVGQPPQLDNSIAVRRRISEWNKKPKPFVWAKTADEILDRHAAYC